MFGRQDRDSVNRDVLDPGFQHKCTTVQNAWLRSYLHLSRTVCRFSASHHSLRGGGASIVKISTGELRAPQDVLLLLLLFGIIIK